jgi:hypothetical protein
MSTCDFEYNVEPPAERKTSPQPVADEIELLPEDEAPADGAASDVAPTGVVDLLLKNQRRIDALLRTTDGQRELIPKLLAVAVCGFALYGVTITVMLNLARANGFWLPGLPAASWNDATGGNLTLAYCLGLIAANGICLPSFYFYGLLAGVRISMLGTAAHALKGMAAGAIALVGILPLYVALALNALIYSGSKPWLAMLTLLALALPFLAGIWGAISLYRGFVDLADTIPAEYRGARQCLLRRLIFAWSGVYTFVTPLVIYSLWQHLSGTPN